MKEYTVLEGGRAMTSAEGMKWTKKPPMGELKGFVVERMSE
jgi:hypothetical protein